VAVKVSVIIPVYNAEHTIIRAVNSVLDQRFESKEIIAVDDGCTDSSFSILATYSDRIRTLRQRNRGAAAARNAGARAATGEYLAFLDADDEWLPGKLRACADALDASPGAAVAYSDMMGSDGTRIVAMRGAPSLDYLLNNSFALFPSATVVRRWVFKRCGGFSEEFKRTDIGEDTFFGLRLREAGEFIHVPEPLVVYNGSRASEAVAKYPGGHRTLTRLAKKRYGRRARGVCSMVRAYYSSLLLGAALEDARARRFGSAFVSLLKAMAASPTNVLERSIKKTKQMARSGERGA
jgi:glycosyltransferase involved in cell wall biosynthesis